MELKDLERFAFLYLCKEEDRELLLGKKEMKFSDFDRLTYLADFFGFETYAVEIWNQYAGGFQKEFQHMEEVVEQKGKGCYLEEISVQDRWLFDFCKGAPDKFAQACLKQMVNQKEGGQNIHGTRKRSTINH